MRELLTTEELLLLENLVYMEKEAPFETVNMNAGKGETVGEWISKIDIDKIDDDQEYTTYTTGADWKNIIQAVKNDETLMNMTIDTAYIDDGENGGGGRSAVFVNPDTGEAVVAFRGTASHEWLDNFVGGGPTSGADGVSTPQQENALDWYQNWYENGGYENASITVIGHSKGGNKAKYITVMDNTVDRCVSFDGQGFSDEFIKSMNDKIAANEDKITNYNVENDYVNILLNDIGKKIYCQGYDYGDGGFLEAHCPNTFFKFNEDGTVEMNRAVYGQNSKMQELDQFFNSFLRTLSDEDKVQTLEIIGRMAELYLGEGSRELEQYLAVIKEGDNGERLGELLVYLEAYLNGEVSKNGNDMAATSGSAGKADFYIYPARIKAQAQELMKMGKILDAEKKQVEKIAGELSGAMLPIKKQLERIIEEMEEEKRECFELGTVLKNVVRLYEKTEMKIIETDIRPIYERLGSLPGA